MKNFMKVFVALGLVSLVLIGTGSAMNMSPLGGADYGGSIYSSGWGSNDWGTSMYGYMNMMFGMLPGMNGLNDDSVANSRFDVGDY